MHLHYNGKKTLCQSLVQSHLDYAISSWYAAMTQKAKTKLQIIQNKMTRFILDLGPRTHITTEHMTGLTTLKIPEILLHRVLLAVVDADYKFVYVDVGAIGCLFKLKLQS